MYSAIGATLNSTLVLLPRLPRPQNPQSKSSAVLEGLNSSRDF